MVENGFFYKVLCVKVGLFYSEIIDEQNFGSQQEAAEFAKSIDPAKLTALVFRMPQDCIAITA